MGAPRSGPNAKNPNSKTSRRIARRTAENITPEMRERRDRFVDALIHGHSKYEAALLAGVPPRSARKEGCTMWCEPYVQEQYKKLREVIEENQIVSRKDVVIGLVTEARREGYGSAHAARVTAWATVAKVMGYEAPKKIEVDANIKGGVMMVPVAGSVDDWEKLAEESQERLKKDVRT